MTRNEILKAAGLTSAGGASQMLRDLENCDFIRECASYGERKERVYRLIDPFILFHYHFLEPRPGDTEFRMPRANTPETGSWQDLAFEMVSRLHTKNMKKRRKRSDYQRASGSKDTIHLTLIAPCGVLQNSYACNLASVVTGEDLFL